MAPRLTLLGKPGCHLCEQMRAVVEEAVAGTGAVLVEEDVRSDPRWQAYRLRSVCCGRARTHSHRVTAPELRRLLFERWRQCD